MALLENGADVNTQNIDGDTALIWACKNQHQNIVELLLRYNALTYLKNNQGFTAFSWAVYKKNKVIFKILHDNLFQSLISSSPLQPSSIMMDSNTINKDNGALNYLTPPMTPTLSMAPPALSMTSPVLPMVSMAPSTLPMVSMAPSTLPMVSMTPSTLPMVSVAPQSLPMVSIAPQTISMTPQTLPMSNNIMNNATPTTLVLPSNTTITKTTNNNLLSDASTMENSTTTVVSTSNLNDMNNQSQQIQPSPLSGLSFSLPKSNSQKNKISSYSCETTQMVTTTTSTTTKLLFSFNNDDDLSSGKYPI